MVPEAGVAKAVRGDPCHGEPRTAGHEKGCVCVQLLPGVSQDCPKPWAMWVHEQSAEMNHPWLSEPSLTFGWQVGSFLGIRVSEEDPGSQSWLAGWSFAPQPEEKDRRDWGEPTTKVRDQTSAVQLRVPASATPCYLQFPFLRVLCGVNGFRDGWGRGCPVW